MRAASSLIAAVAILALFSSVRLNAQALDTPPANLTPAAKKIWVKLQTIIIDKCNVENLDLTIILPFLTKRSKELDPEHVGVKFILIGPYTPPIGGPIHREISMTLTDVPLCEVVSYFCQQTEHQWKIEDDAVIVFPAKTPPPSK
jgi:hypothetical protein